MDLPQPNEGSTDVFSLSDQVLSDKLQFVEEIGFGNWGSVWLCRPKEDLDSPSADGLVKPQETKLAVKLVHRSKTSTTAARVRSLWNEMKIVRSFKSDPHPSIIPFHSFIITPSYALITMAYLPALVPVEVDEVKACEWFRFLLSGVEFLHKRGVVHNDIKPANILLSSKNIPVLVDFGFAEKYDTKSRTAFHSNLSYGTPEYLSPERARGLPHDTRKSDVWSLGVTFFEILIGRTPFEHSDAEQFSTKEDLEKYWARTLRGKWVGTWNMSKTIEKLLRRMISPNADLRCTATDAMNDPYWRQVKEPAALHRRSASYNSSVMFEKDASKLGTPASPWSTNAKENRSPPGLNTSPGFSHDSDSLRRSITKAKSQPRVSGSKIQVQARKRVPLPSVVDLSPIKGSPPASLAGRQNPASLASLTAAANTRKPLGTIGARTRENLPRAPSAVETAKDARKVRPLAELTANRNTKERGKHDSVKDRVREWEREKERLREMERLDELERDRDAQFEEERERAARQQRAVAARGREQDKENKENQSADVSGMFSPPRPVAPPPTPEVRTLVSSPTINVSNSNTGFAMNSFKHSVKLSFDKTLQFYKNTALTSRHVSSQTLSGELQDDALPRRESWEDEAFERDAKTSLPVVRHALHNERVAADNRQDRMAIWMRNVEQVVEDARQNFASSSKDVMPLPPLPLAPLSRATSQTRTSFRASRLPRKVLAASQIFADSVNIGASQDISSLSLNAAANSTVAHAELDLSPSQMQTPTRPRRATVSTRSPEPADALFDLDAEASPSRRKEKSRSHADLLQRRIAPIALLELEIAKPIQVLPPLSPRLCDVLDRSLLIASPTPRDEDGDVSSRINRTPERSFDELTSSPLHVHPYPARTPAASNIPVPDTPAQRRLEGVYDRFLMATTGVSRLGKGYQSNNAGPVSFTLGPSTPAPVQHRAFHSARRAMRPPVSSADAEGGGGGNRQSASVDELGVMTYAGPATGTPREGNGNTTITLVRRAFKAIVPGKTVSRRLSRRLN